MTLNRFIKFFKLPLDITAIEIKKTDDIYKDIEFLDYDPNYQKGYQIYKDTDIHTTYFHNGGEAVSSSGRFIKINKNENDLCHTIIAEPGASGSPIIVLPKK